MKRLTSFVIVALAASCGGGPSGPAILSTPITSFEFESTGGPVVAHTFVFSNVGGRPTGNLSASILGAAAQFAIHYDGCSNLSLQPGNQCQVDVQLSGEVAAAYQAELHVTSSDVDATVELSGVVSPSHLTFILPTAGAVEVVAGSSAGVTVSIHNAGGANSGTLTIDDPGHFVSHDTCTGTVLAGGASCTVDVTATAALAATGEVDVSFDVEEGNNSTLLGVTVPFTVTLGPPLDVISGGDFGAQDPTTAPIWKFYIFNESDLPSEQTELSLSGGQENQAATSPFVLVSGQNFCSGTTLASSASCGAQITIDPTLPPLGDYSANVIVRGLGKQPRTVPLHVHTTQGHVTVTVSDSGVSDGFIESPLQYLCGPSMADEGCGTLVVGDGWPTTFTAYPVEETTAKFVRWSGGPCIGSTSSQCTVTPHGMDIALSAEFEPK